MASFLYSFFQFIKHFLKSRSYKDLAFLFRKKKRLLNNCWVSGAHLVLPWCLHTDFQNLFILHNQWWRIRITKLVILTQVEQGRGTLQVWLSTAPKPFPLTKMLNDTPRVDAAQSPQCFQTFPLLSHPVLCSTEYNPPVSVSHFRAPVALWSPSSGSQQ